MLDGLSLAASVVTLANVVAEAVIYVRTLCHASKELKALQVRSASRGPMRDLGIRLSAQHLDASIYRTKSSTIPW